MSELVEYALVGKGFSGRGVRLRVLEPDERDEIVERSAQEAGAEATNIQFSNLVLKNCLCRMVQQVTKETGLPDAEKVHAATWVDVSERQLAGEKGSNLNSFFNAKDQDVLGRIYKEAHEATKAEIDAIMGKAVRVSTD